MNTSGREAVKGDDLALILNKLNAVNSEAKVSEVHEQLTSIYTLRVAHIRRLRRVLEGWMNEQGSFVVYRTDGKPHTDKVPYCTECPAKGRETIQLALAEAWAANVLGWGEKHSTENKRVTEEGKTELVLFHYLNTGEILDKTTTEGHENFLKLFQIEGAVRKLIGDMAGLQGGILHRVKGDVGQTNKNLTHMGRQSRDEEQCFVQPPMVSDAPVMDRLNGPWVAHPHGDEAGSSSYTNIVRHLSSKNFPVGDSQVGWDIPPEQIGIDSTATGALEELVIRLKLRATRLETQVFAQQTHFINIADSLERHQKEIDALTGGDVRTTAVPGENRLEPALTLASAPTTLQKHFSETPVATGVEASPGTLEEHVRMHEDELFEQQKRLINIAHTLEQHQKEIDALHREDVRLTAVPGENRLEPALTLAPAPTTLRKPFSETPVATGVETSPGTAVRANKAKQGLRWPSAIFTSVTRAEQTEPEAPQNKRHRTGPA